MFASSRESRLEKSFSENFKMATDYFGHTLAPMENHDLPYSISLHGTLHVTQVALGSFLEGRTYLYVRVYDGEEERTHLIACLIPVVHEFVTLNLFFTARQTVSFIAFGKNALSISGMIERAVAQEEDEVNIFASLVCWFVSRILVW
jgi:hypothetical protein